MIAQRPVYFYARVVLEAITPHGVHAGHGDITHDVLLVRDGNGLPVIPGTSLAGVLRHLYADAYGKAPTHHVFGHAEGSEGQPSYLSIMAGLVNDSQNRAVEGLRDHPEKDPVLAFLLEDKPLVRQRVSLGARGTAKDTGKFDVTLIPAGTRYTTFIGYWATDAPEEQAVFERLMALLHSPAFRLGHGTRSGSGAFKVQSLATARWDLRSTEGRDSYCQRPRKRVESQGLSPCFTELPIKEMPIVSAHLPLQVEAGLRIGGGEIALSGVDAEGRLPDLLPQSERRISWQDNQGSISEPVAVVPGSAIKGAIAHRLGFHCRRLEGELINPAVTSLPDDQPHTLVKKMLGWAAEEVSNEGEAGRLLIDDIYFEQPSVMRQTHNRIDRYTGGVMQGALFEQEVLWQPSLKLTLTVLSPHALHQTLRQALEATLDDLASGRLPLGASGSRGQGSLIGTNAIIWSDGGAWLAQSPQEDVA